MPKCFQGNFVKSVTKFQAALKIVLRGRTVIQPPFKNEKLRNIGHGMCMSLGTINSFLGSLQWLWFHIWFIMRLYYLMRQILLQNVTAILLQRG